MRIILLPHESVDAARDLDLNFDFVQSLLVENTTMGSEQSRESWKMPDSLMKEFTSIEENCRVLALMEMVKVCSYQQKLELLEQLQSHLHRDFLTQLPSHLSEKIISFLSIDDARKCLLVSKSWNEVISCCTAYWKTRADKIGLSDAFVQQMCPGLKGLKDICISALNHHNYVKSLIPKPILIGRSPDDASHSFMYAGNGVVLRYTDLNSNSHSQITIERMNTLHSLMLVAVFTMEAITSRIKWVSASDKYILWKQLDGKWLGCSTKAPTEEPVQWDDEPASPFHSISLCHKCHLVAIVSEAEDDCEVWDLQVIKLIEGKSTPRKSVYPLPLENVIKEKKRHLLGGKVMLLSERHEKDSTGFCKSHKVLLQIDNCVAVHRLESVTDTEHVLVIHHLLPDAKLSKPLHIFSPRSDKQAPSMMEGSGGKGQPSFCLSADKKTMGAIHECYLYRWNLDTYTEDSCVDLIDLNMPNDTQCIAIGNLYTVLTSNSCGVCTVISTSTGKMVLRACLDESKSRPSAFQSSRFNFFPPLRQEWLNTFDYFDFWPLALVFDYSAVKNGHTREHELESLVGTLRGKGRFH